VLVTDGLPTPILIGEAVAAYVLITFPLAELYAPFVRHAGGA